MSSLYEKAVAKRIKLEKERSAKKKYGKQKYGKKLKGIEKRKAFLIKKGYDLSDKDEQFINNLYGMYFRTEPSRKHQQKGWAMWGRTNRPHHMGGSKPKYFL